MIFICVLAIFLLLACPCGTPNPQCDQEYPVPIGINTTVQLECFITRPSQYAVDLHIHTSDSNNTCIASNLTFPGYPMYHAVSRNPVTFSLNAEDDIWISYCVLILYNASNVASEFITFNRTCFIADESQTHANNTNVTGSSTSSDGVNADKMITPETGSDVDGTKHLATIILASVLTPLTFLTIVIGVLCLWLTVKYCKCCNQSDNNSGVVQVSQVEQHFDTPNAPESTGVHSLRSPIECTEESDILIPTVHVDHFVYTTTNFRMPIGEMDCIVSSHRLYSKQSNRYLVFEEATEAIGSFNAKFDKPTHLGRITNIQKNLPSHHVHRTLDPVIGATTDSCTPQATVVFSGSQSHSVDQDSLEYHGFVDMESVPSTTSVLVCASHLSGKIQHFNPAAVGSKENESCDVVSLGGAISSRDSLPTTDNADEIINDTLVPFSYPTVSEEVMQWLDSNGDPVTSPGLLKDGFIEVSIGSTRSMCDEKGVHWLLCPDTCIKDINASARSLLSPNPLPVSHKQDFVPPLDTQPFMLKVKYDKVLMQDIFKETVCCQG